MKRLLSAVAGLVVLSLLVAGVRRPPHRAVRAEETTAVDSAVDRGRVIYQRYGCALCHGADGKGGFANPNAETDGRVRGVIYVAEGYTPDELRRLILNGSPPIGKADPNGPTPPYRMPGWGDRMTEQEASDLVQYLVSLFPKTAEETWC